MRQHALHVALAVVVLALAAGAAAVAPAAAVSALGGPAEPTAEAQVGNAVADPTEPTLSAPNTVNRTANLTATVTLPVDATERREFVVRVDAIGGSTVANESVTLDPGEARTLDFGACLPDGNLVVRVRTPDGDILVADTVEVQQPTPVVSLPGDDDGYERSVRRNETLRVNATYHGCSDRATFQLDGFGDDEQVRWRATVVDVDADGAVSFAWDVDAPAGERLGAAEDGTRLVNASANATPPYGAYSLAVTSEGQEVASDSVTVSFADPQIRAYTADARKNASEALAAARRGEPVGGPGIVNVVEDDWVVLRIDTDGTLDSLPADASLVAPARHENVTVRVHERYGVETADGDRVPDLANATRHFDAKTGTLWYAYRADARNATTEVEYVAIGDGWNATPGVVVNPVDAVHLGLAGPSDDLLARGANVTVRGLSPLPEGTTLTVAVRADDRVVATDEVPVDDESRFWATLDLSGVANGTNATLTVAEDGRRIHEQRVRVVSKPVLSLRGFHVEDGLVAGDPATVRVYVLNRGTEAGRGTVTVRIGNETRTERTRVPTGESVIVRVPFESGVVPNNDTVEVAASFAGDTKTRAVDVETTRTTPPDPITSTPPSTTSTGTEPWPTLAGGPRTTSTSPLPGFGLLAAAVALATTSLLLRRRSRSGQD